MWEIRYIPYRGMPRLGWLGAVDNSPPWHRSLIVEFLASSTLLTNLELSLDKAADLKGLERLAGLRRLKIEVYCQPFLAPETLGRQVTHIVAHNRHLCSLQLATSRREDPGWSEIWTLLRTERIYLKQISDNAISTEFLEYLSSYSGLERLTLHPLGCSAVNSGRLADMFFDAVLPRHADSLVELSCLAEFEGKWSFGAHNAEQISQLKQLTRLEMSVNSYDMATTESDRRSSKNTVELMLETAAQLHAVRIIAILPAESELNRRDGTGHDGNPSTHKGAVLLNIKTTVRSFRPCSTSPAIVRAGYTFHELKKSATTPDTFAYCEYEHPNISWQRIKYLMEEE
ncbi:hypothetical protein C8R44DRAFT_781279 [Mycena epipterygia]|nr:hypothetical protein C8R44DRAFT_781279 [Mycena epipterygia]